MDQFYLFEKGYSWFGRWAEPFFFPKKIKSNYKYLVQFGSIWLLFSCSSLVLLPCFFHFHFPTVLLSSLPFSHDLALPLLSHSILLFGLARSHSPILCLLLQHKLKRGRELVTYAESDLLEKKTRSWEGEKKKKKKIKEKKRKCWGRKKKRAVIL